MAGRGNVQKECDRLNRQRDVSTCSTMRLDRFWQRARGSFVIDGGGEAGRAQALAAKLGWEMACASGPTLLLTCSRTLEALLIARVRETGTGWLQLSSPSYRTYDYFYGWDESETAGFLVALAHERGLASPELVRLALAFVCVLMRSEGAVSLGALVALAQRDAAQVAALGAQLGVAREHVDTLRSAQAQTQGTLRLLLGSLHTALGTSAAWGETTRYNLSSAGLAANGTYLVNVASSDPATINAYFAHEIQRVLARGQRVRVVLADVPLTAQDPLVEALRAAQMQGFEVGVCLLAAAGVLGIRDDGSAGLAFGTRVVLLDDAPFDDDALAVALQPLGSYTYHYPVHAAPNSWLSLGPEGEWSMASEQRLRVRPEDTRGYAGVFFGAFGHEVRLARSYQ